MLTYTLKTNARSRHIRVAIKADGSCVVTTPRRVPQVLIDRFLQEKSTWILESIEKVKKTASPYSWLGTAAELKTFKSSALRLAKDRLAHFNQLYGFKIGEIGIRNQQTRWGSCSSTGRINFTYKICLLPPHLADYIIVHELCHLGEMNHSPRFWALVARALPEYRLLKRELQYGAPKN
jgi:predicted metal-dependent hydrolase